MRLASSMLCSPRSATSIESMPICWDGGMWSATAKIIFVTSSSIRRRSGSSDSECTADDSMLFLALSTVGIPSRAPRPGDDVPRGRDLARIIDVPMADLVVPACGLGADLAGIRADDRARGLVAGRSVRPGRRLLRGREQGAPEEFRLACVCDVFFLV